jgi:hypothetical protein
MLKPRIFTWGANHLPLSVTVLPRAIARASLTAHKLITLAKP